MPIKLNPFERVLGSLNLLPTPVMDEWLYMWSARSLLTAQELGVFDALNNGPMTGLEIAGKVGASSRAIGHLLDTLVSLGYLKKNGMGYTNTRTSAKWLVKQSPHYVGDWQYITELLWRMSENLTEVLRSGLVKENGFDFLNANPEWWPKIEASWRAMASPGIASKFKLASSARRLIDIGGGHGLYSVAFCRKYPSLTATIFDWPKGIQSARETVESAGMLERIGFHEGDFMTDDLGTDYDVALLFNIIHGHDSRENVFLLRKTAEALNKNGTVLILDQIRGSNRSRLSSLVAETTGLNLFLWTGGKTYTFEEVRSWLTDAGFVSIQEKKGRTSSLISGSVGN
jgi:O-methyltransferase domain/Dimerisation domain